MAWTNRECGKIHPRDGEKLYKNNTQINKERVTNDVFNLFIMCKSINYNRLLKLFL